MLDHNDLTPLVGKARYDAVVSERNRYAEALRWFADGEWVEDDPLKARDHARAVLRSAA